MSDASPNPDGDMADHGSEALDIDQIDVTEVAKRSPLLARLIEEVRLEQADNRTTPQGYNRMHNRQMSKPTHPHNRFHNRHNRSR